MLERGGSDKGWELEHQCHDAPPLETEEPTSVNALGKLASAANMTSIIILAVVILSSSGKFLPFPT